MNEVKAIRCGACGHESAAATLSKDHAERPGSPDLDGRPPRSRPWTSASPEAESPMATWAHQCPGCGACAPARVLAALRPAERELAAAASKDGDRWATEPPHPIVRRFVVWSFLAKRLALPAAEAWAWLHAAWASDDLADARGYGHDAGAVPLRLEFVRLARLLPEFAAEPAARLVVVDAMRRARSFEPAEIEASKVWGKLDSEDPLHKAFFFEGRMANLGNADAFRASDALWEHQHAVAFDVPSQAAGTRWAAARQSAATSDGLTERTQRFYDAIRRDGHLCDHCGEPGRTNEYYLSIGRASTVICRRCHWPQEVP